ncbi:hypothetical protein [Thalassotalea agariperforans]
MLFHRFIALALFIIYLLIFNGYFEHYSGFNKAQIALNHEVIHIAHRGIGVVYLLAGFSCYLLFFPQHAMEKFSPKSKMLCEPILKSGFWIIAGYFVSSVVFLLLEVFK